MNETSKVLHYRTRILHSLADVGQNLWDQLILSQPNANPFLSYAFLHALHESGSASTQTGWSPCYLSLWDGESLAAVMPLYEKSHSYGEYVFDWAWAEAYHQHGLNYYPKLVSAVPFTPITGARLIARDAQAQQALLNELIRLQTALQVSSTHILFPAKEEVILLANAGFLLRQGIQFHWQNQAYSDFEEFLSSLEKKKRKNIRAERRKVAELGIEFQHLCGHDIHADDWHFFKCCYDKTYSEHHSSPYLNLDFFLRIGASMPQNIHLIIAQQAGNRIAASLLIHDTNIVYGRYWGCIEQIPCLHFETAYYQAIEFCIENKIKTFEGGAQGEHKMARGFLPTKTYSAHSLAEKAFSDAVANFLLRETGGIENYFSELDEKTPYKHSTII